MGAQGTAILDFGAFPGTTDASVAVTGQAGIVSGSLVEAWIRPADTAEHSADEHVMGCVMFDVVASDIVPGAGFTIRAVARDLGGQSLDPPGIGRGQMANATAGLNFGQWPTQVGSVGGQCLNTIWGTFNVAWVWN